MTVATFADDTAILSTGEAIEQSTAKLQETVDQVINWTKKWRIKLNETKSVHVNFTNRRLQHYPRIIINATMIPHSNTAKYLGMTLDSKFRWKELKRKKKNLILNLEKCTGS